MTSIWRKFFGFTDEEHEGETYDEAVQRAKKLLHEENYEDACRILRYAEKQHHAEAMYYLAWCYWNGTGVREDMKEKPTRKPCKEPRNFCTKKTTRTRAVS